MGDPVYLFVSCSAVPAVHSDMAVCYGALYCIPLVSSGPDRPGDRLGPTYGGSIGPQGMEDTSYPSWSLLATLPAASTACPYATNGRAPRSAGE